MLHEIVKDPNKQMWNVITLEGVSGGVYWFGGMKGASERPYNLIFKRKDEGMFKDMNEVSDFINNIK